MSRLDKDFTATLQMSPAQGARTFVVLPHCHVHRHRGLVKIVSTVDGQPLRSRLARLFVYPVGDPRHPAVVDAYRPGSAPPGRSVMARRGEAGLASREYRLGVGGGEGLL